jgi:hypothetical protein
MHNAVNSCHISLQQWSKVRREIGAAAILLSTGLVGRSTSQSAKGYAGTKSQAKAMRSNSYHLPSGVLHREQGMWDVFRFRLRMNRISTA